MSESLSTTTLSPASVEQLRAYRDDGFLILRQVFPMAEIDTWREECERLRTLPDSFLPGDERTTVSDRSGVRPALDRLDPVIDLSPVFARLARDERILIAVGAAIDDKALLFKDKLILKPPGASGYDLHRDWPYWYPVAAPPDRMLTAVVPLDASNAKNGAMELFSQHRSASIAPTEKHFDQALLDEKTSSFANLNPGDLLLIHSLIPHRSGPNRSSGHRRHLLLTYSAASYGDLYADYYRLKHEQSLADQASASGLLTNWAPSVVSLK